MKFAVLACVVAIAAAGAELEFQDADKKCSMTLIGDSGGSPVIKNHCGFSTKSFYSDEIGTKGHSNIANAVDSAFTKITGNTDEISTVSSKVDDLVSDTNDLMNNIAADTYCNAMKLFKGNMHAVKLQTADKGMTGNEICKRASDEMGTGNWGTTGWVCVSGATRIAPDHASDYRQLAQHYGGPNSGNWASHYWRYSCDTVMEYPTNGPTYVCCDSHGGSSTDLMADLTTKITGNTDKTSALTTKVDDLANKVVGLQTEIDETQSDLTQMTFDMIADVWCGSKQDFGANTHAVRVKESGKRTCAAWCEFASKDIFYQGVKRTWSCLAGSTRIAPDFAHQYTHIGQSYGGPHKGNWASYYWAQGCGTTADGNGQTYCCCKG